MSITTQQDEIEIQAIDMKQRPQTFTIIILERYPTYLIVKKGSRKLLFNIKERSLKLLTTGRMMYIGVQKTLKDRYLI